MLGGHRIAEDIAAMSYGKAIYVISPLMTHLDPEKRARLFRYLADEYTGFEDSIRGVLRTAEGSGEPAGVSQVFPEPHPSSHTAEVSASS